MAERLANAGVIKGGARNQLRLKTALNLDLGAVAILDRRAAGGGTARSGVGPARPASNDVARPVGDDVGQLPDTRVLWSELPGVRQPRGARRRCRGLSRRRLAAGRLVVASEALCRILQLCASSKRFVGRPARRCPERG